MKGNFRYAQLSTRRVVICISVLLINSIVSITGLSREVVIAPNMSRLGDTSADRNSSIDRNISKYKRYQAISSEDQWLFSGLLSLPGSHDEE